MGRAKGRKRWAQFYGDEKAKKRIEEGRQPEPRRGGRRGTGATAGPSARQRSPEAEHGQRDPSVAEHEEGRWPSEAEMDERLRQALSSPKSSPKGAEHAQMNPPAVEDAARNEPSEREREARWRQAQAEQYRAQDEAAPQPGRRRTPQAQQLSVAQQWDQYYQEQARLHGAPARGTRGGYATGQRPPLYDPYRQDAPLPRGGFPGQRRPLPERRHEAFEERPAAQPQSDRGRGPGRGRRRARQPRPLPPDSLYDGFHSPTEQAAAGAGGATQGQESLFESQSSLRGFLQHGFHESPAPTQGQEYSIDDPRHPLYDGF